MHHTNTIGLSDCAPHSHNGDVRLCTAHVQQGCQIVHYTDTFLTSDTRHVTEEEETSDSQRNSGVVRHSRHLIDTVEMSETSLVAPGVLLLTLAAPVPPRSSRDLWRRPARRQGSQRYLHGFIPTGTQKSRKADRITPCPSAAYYCSGAV